MLLSGGDPLTMSPKLLERVLRGLREIAHIEIVRLGTRVPVFMPQRVDDDLCEMLEKYHPLWVNLHFNHPNEITPEVSRAVDKLSRTGIPIGNQSVLLAGVNDCVHIQRELVHKLVENRIRPYYLYQCDLVEGAGHFRTPVGKGLEIIEGLRGHTSGYAVPTYVVDAPGGGGKIPVMPNYLISYSDHKVVLRNYEGYITTYEEPTEYTPHDRRSLLATAATSAPSPARAACTACSRAMPCGSSRPVTPRSTPAATPRRTACRRPRSGCPTASAPSRARRLGASSARGWRRATRPRVRTGRGAAAAPRASPPAPRTASCSSRGLPEAAPRWRLGRAAAAAPAGEPADDAEWRQSAEATFEAHADKHRVTALAAAVRPELRDHA